MQPVVQVAIATESDRPAGQEGVVTVTLDPLPVYEADLQDKSTHQDRECYSGFIWSDLFNMYIPGISHLGHIREHSMMVEFTAFYVRIFAV